MIFHGGHDLQAASLDCIQFAFLVSVLQKKKQQIFNCRDKKEKLNSLLTYLADQRSTPIDESMDEKSSEFISNFEPASSLRIPWGRMWNPACLTKMANSFYIMLFWSELGVLNRWGTEDWKHTLRMNKHSQIAEAILCRGRRSMFVCLLIPLFIHQGLMWC